MTTDGWVVQLELDDLVVDLPCSDRPADFFDGFPDDLEDIRLAVYAGIRAHIEKDMQ